MSPIVKRDGQIMHGTASNGYEMNIHVLIFEV